MITINRIDREGDLEVEVVDGVALEQLICGQLSRGADGHSRYTLFCLINIEFTGLVGNAQSWG